MNTEKVMEVLRRFEWSRGCSGMGTYCPWCHNWRSEGHRDDCKLDALLNEGEKERAGVDKWSHEELYIKALEAAVRTVWRWTRSSPTT